MADQLLVAAGRTPNLDDLGLETVGLDPAARTVDVDERMRAGERLWAIGDITGHGAFTHVSMYQSAVALRDITGQDGPTATYHAVPHTTFTDPEVGGVGLTERAARDAGLRVRVGADAAGAVLARLRARSRWARPDQGGGGCRPRCAGGSDRDGPRRGEILGFLAVAVHAGVPTATLSSMIFTYPTFHRAIETALGNLE